MFLILQDLLEMRYLYTVGLNLGVYVQEIAPELILASEVARN